MSSTKLHAIFWQNLITHVGDHHSVVSPSWHSAHQQHTCRPQLAIVLVNLVVLLWGNGLHLPLQHHPHCHLTRCYAHKAHRGECCDILKAWKTGRASHNSSQAMWGGPPVDQSLRRTWSVGRQTMDANQVQLEHSVAITHLGGTWSVYTSSTSSSSLLESSSLGKAAILAG